MDFHEIHTVNIYLVLQLCNCSETGGSVECKLPEPSTRVSAVRITHESITQASQSYTHSSLLSPYSFIIWLGYESSPKPLNLEPTKLTIWNVLALAFCTGWGSWWYSGLENLRGMKMFCAWSRSHGYETQFKVCWNQGVLSICLSWVWTKMEMLLVIWAGISHFVDGQSRHLHLDHICLPGKSPVLFQFMALITVCLTREFAD